MKTLFWSITVALLATAIAEEVTVLQSSSLCTNISTAENGVIYRVHAETGQCHIVGEKGPCGDMMIFYGDPLDSDKGDCDCDHKYRCHRPMVYWPSTQRCYVAFDQGPCETGSWLVFDQRMQPYCEKNPCTSNFTEFEEENSNTQFWFHSGNECIKTGTQGYCTYPNEVMAFDGFSNKIWPKCSVVEYECKLRKNPCLFCLPGQKWALGENCCTHRSRKFHRHHQGGQHHHPRRHHRHNHNHHHHQDIESHQSMIEDFERNEFDESIDRHRRNGARGRKYKRMDRNMN